MKAVALFLCGRERFAVLLQQGLHFGPSRQTVGFALEPAVLSSPLPLQDIQHPEEQIWRAWTYLTRKLWQLSEAGAGSYCGPSFATSSLGPARTNRPAPFSSPTVRKTKVSFSRTKTIVKYLPRQQQEVGTLIKILLECLFHWQWYSWSLCHLLFWKKKWTVINVNWTLIWIFHSLKLA